MIAMILLLKRKPGMTRQQFRQHYETSHVMLAKKHLGHLFHDYRRHYVGDVIAMRGEEVVVNAVEEGAYDVITKIVFKDQAAVDEFWRIYAIPEVFAELRADDPIPAYRLSAASKLPAGGTLASRWKPVLEPVLAQFQQQELIVDLRSGSYEALGKIPGAVTVDPSGKFAYVVNRLSNDVSAYTIDASSVFKFDGPTMSTPHAYSSGVNTRPASVA